MATIFYRLTVQGNYKGSNWNNVFHYRTNDSDNPSASELNGAWTGEWMNALRGIMNVICAINSIYSVRTDDLGDYASSPIGLFGQVGTSASAMPAQYASCLTANTTGSVIRHGYKRFTGVDESMMTQGDLATPFVAPFDVIKTKMQTVIQGVTASYTPVVVRYNTASPPVIVLSAAIDNASFRNFNTQRSRIQ